MLFHHLSVVLILAVEQLLLILLECFVKLPALLEITFPVSRDDKSRSYEQISGPGDMVPCEKAHSQACVLNRFEREVPSSLNSIIHG